MHVTTGRSAARSTLLFRLSLAAGLAIVAATLALVWFYRWRELSDLRQHDALLHDRLALAIAAPAPAGSEPGNPAASLALARDSDRASYILSRSLFGAYGASAMVWGLDGRQLAFGGAPLPAYASPGPRPALGPARFFEGDGKAFQASFRETIAIGRPAILEIRTDLTEASARIDSRAADVALWAFFLEGVLIGFLLLIARKGDERLRDSEREQIALESELFFLAHYDAITHLPNRSLFWERLDAAIGRAARLNKAVSLMVFDLKEFKRLNEELGRGAGDRALIEAARRLQAAVRSSDLVCRIGSDEFAVMLEDMDPAGAEEASARLAQAVERQFLAPWSEGSGVWPLSFTGGGALFPRDGQNSEELLSQAQCAQTQALAAAEPFLLFQPPPPGSA